MLPHLSFDIQVEIIKKLPIKSLIQFRSVCKAWKSLIDSSRFIAGYNDRHDLLQHLVARYADGIKVKYVSFVGDDDTFPQQMLALTVPPLVQPKAKKTVICGSSHGLLLLAEYYGYDATSFVIWNPAIKKSIAVVVPPNPDDKCFSFFCWFWVCPVTKDPKLVKMTYIRDLSKMESISIIPCQVMIFTLSSGEWKSFCGSSLPRQSIEVSYVQTAVGRFINWLALDRWIAENGGDRFRNLILSFDMSTEEFREIDLPESMTERYLSFSRLRESLAVVEYSGVGYGEKQVCDVWMMEHGDFTKLYTIKVPNISHYFILGFTKSGEAIVEIIDDFEKVDSTNTLVIYEPCSENIKDLGIHGIRRVSCVGSDTESLLLLDHDDGHVYGEVTFGTVN